MTNKLSHAKLIDTRTAMPLGNNAQTSSAIRETLKRLGADRVNLHLPETGALPYVLHPGEEIQGIVYGRYKQDNTNLVGRGALVATTERVFLLDKKPLFIRCEEIIYDAINGTSYGRVGFTGTVVLHTKVGDAKIRTLNQKCARSFVQAVEARIFAGKGHRTTITSGTGEPVENQTHM